MRTHRTPSRRSVLAGAGTAAVAAVAGCQGDSDSEGENSTLGDEATTIETANQDDAEDGDVEQENVENAVKGDGVEVLGSRDWSGSVEEDFG